MIYYQQETMKMESSQHEKSHQRNKKRTNASFSFSHFKITQKREHGLPTYHFQRDFRKPT